MIPSQDALQGRAPIHSDRLLLAVLQYLLGHAVQRQIWMFFFDAQQRIIKLMIPINDHPFDPDELHEAEDFGLISFPHLFVRRALMIAEQVEARSYAIVWERPGSEKFNSDDLNWASAFVRFAAMEQQQASVPKLRGLFLMHDGGVRPVTPDDYA